MTSIRIINEAGQLELRETVSRNAVVYRYDSQDQKQDQLEPAVVQTVEYDHTGQTSQITTVCGETENRRENDDKPDMTISGILTSSQLETAKALRDGEKVRLVSDVHQGDVFVKRLTITQDSDLVHYIEDGEEELAFSFQLQLKQPE